MQTRNPSKETTFAPFSGYLMLAFEILLLVASAWCFVASVQEHQNIVVVRMLTGVAGFIAFVLMLSGFFVVEPNMARVLVLFGRYRGSVRTPGFWWTNPFTTKKRISLRAYNLNGKELKVNDLLGNPVEIAAIVVWQVRDTAQALFDVEGFEHFVDVQCESALRLVASRHPYDDGQTSDVSTTLRGSADVVAHEVQTELQQRLAIAGVDVLEARLSHLAYAPEIAAAMLQRQQAGAIIAARTRMVEGAVGMVEMALDHLSKKEVVHLDDERRATLVGNLLVVLCGHVAPTPVLNTGSLYT
jgi:regulator of protease activity HflC (stomatin/prohibitin superfamily)